MEIREMNLEQIEARRAEIKAMLESGNECDVNALTTEVDELEQRAKEINEAIEARKALMGRVNAGEGRVIEQEDPEMNEAEVRAENFVKTGRLETRALLSTGAIAKPTKVGGVNGLAAVADSIVDDVNAIALTGNGAWSVGYKTADAVAADVVDGKKIAGAGAAFATIDITPAEWGVLDEVSKQVAKMTPLAYESAIEQSALVALRVKAADTIVKKVLASGLAVKKVYKIDADYLKNAALNFRSIAGKGACVLYLNQADLIALGAVRGTNEKKALFDISFDAGTNTSGTISEGGLAVKFRVLDQLTAGTQLYGQPLTIDMPMWDNYTVETDEGGDYFQRNMIGIRGLQTANADLTSVAGMHIISQTA